MGWFQRKDGEFRPDGEKLDDIEFKPDEFKKELESSIESKLNTLSEKQQEQLKPILDMAEAIKTEREQRAAAKTAEQQRKNKEEEEVGTEDYLLDPAEATRRQIEPTNRAVLAMAAKMQKQETLGDKEYYHGDIKSKVDAMLASQPLTAQTRADVIENAYKIAVFDHQKDIAEGKIKSRNAAAVFEGSSTGGHSGKEGKESGDVLSQEEKEVAKRMGISDKDWAASKRELSYV